MEPKFITKKIIIVLGLLVVSFNFFITFVHFFSRETTTICYEKSGVTIVANSGIGHPIIASEAAPKDALSCMGKSIPYYSRVVGTILSTDTIIHQQINQRYIYKPEKNRRDEIEIELVDKLYLIYLKGELIIVGSNEGISPFTVAKYLADDSSVVVYMPENSPEIDDLARKVIDGRGRKFYTLKTGDQAFIKSF